MNTYKRQTPERAVSVQALLDAQSDLGVEVAYLPAVTGWLQWDLAVALRDAGEAGHADHVKAG